MPRRRATCLGAVATLLVGLAGDVCFAQTSETGRTDEAASSETSGSEDAEGPSGFGDMPPKPLMTLKEEKRLTGRIRIDHVPALKSPNPRAADERLIDELMRYRVYRTTLEENYGDLASRSRELLTDLEQYAGTNPRTREIALKSAVKYLADLLDQPRNVRLNAVYLLGRLTERNEQINPRIHARHYAPAADPLMQVLGDTQQPLEVKIAALYGLGKIFRYSDVRRQKKDEITQALIDALDASEALPAGVGRDWFQWRLVDTLGLVKEPRTRAQQPIVVDALWKVMQDGDRSWWIRTRALRSISQLDLDSTFNIELLLYQTVQMTGRMAGAQVRRPADPQWRICFTDVYFAFWPQEQEERDAGWGLRVQAQRNLRTHSALVDSAYQAVLPLINAVTSEVPAQARPISGGAFNKADEWIKSNRPDKLKIHEGAEPIELEKPPQPAPDSSNHTPNTVLNEAVAGAERNRP